ncbi:MAG: IclR family transcriptional regulator [Xanthobacteraceae bacterium]
MTITGRHPRKLHQIDPRAQPNLNLARGLLILEAFSPERTEWGVRDLAREMRTNATTIHRLMTTLENFGYVEQDMRSKRYRLGAKIMSLANTYSDQNPLPIIARRVFHEFSGRFAHSFYLGVLNNFDVIYTAVLDGRGALKISMQPGGRTAVYSTGMGKVLLAYQPESFVEAFLAAVPLKAHTPHTNTSAQRLRRDLHEIQRLGYAVNYGEHFEEIGAVAVPVRGNKGEVVAGLSLGFPIHWLAAKRLEIKAMVALAHEIADEIAMRTTGRSY